MSLPVTLLSYQNAVEHLPPPSPHHSPFQEEMMSLLMSTELTC